MMCPEEVLAASRRVGCTCRLPGSVVVGLLAVPPVPFWYASGARSLLSTLEVCAMSDAILFEMRGPVALITINRPESRNAINA